MKECLMQQGEFMIRILLAGICGAAIGYERKAETKKQVFVRMLSYLWGQP